MSDNIKSAAGDNFPYMYSNPPPPASFLAPGDANSTNNPSISDEELNLYPPPPLNPSISDEEHHSCPGAPRNSYVTSEERYIYPAADPAASDSSAAAPPVVVDPPPPPPHNTRVIIHTDVMVHINDVSGHVRSFREVIDAHFHYSGLLAQGPVMGNGGDQTAFLSSEITLGEDMVKHGSGDDCPLGCDLV